MKLIPILKILSQKRPVFHSEADFQHALAWAIHEKYPKANLRLEMPLDKSKGNERMDIRVEYRGELWAIELKYLTAELCADYQDENFDLRKQSAHDRRRYGFVKDIERLENWKRAGKKHKGGIALLLTNDAGYWKKPLPDWREKVDAKFRIHEGAKLAGKREWSPHAGGAKKGLESPIILTGKYEMRWQDYRRLRAGDPEKNRLFRFLLVEV